MEQLDAMMRAAHSLKERPGLWDRMKPPVLPHAMEDCLVAAQKGLLRLDSGKIDILFQGVDMLNRIAEHVGESKSAWLSHQKKKVDRVKTAIMGIVSAGPDVVPERFELRETSTVPVILESDHQEADIKQEHQQPSQNRFYPHDGSCHAGSFSGGGGNPCGGFK